MLDVHAQIQEHARRVVLARAAQLEIVCERALQGGEFGVLVDGDAARVDHRVPYGRIYDVTACGPNNVRDWSLLS